MVGAVTIIIALVVKMVLAAFVVTDVAGLVVIDVIGFVVIVVVIFEVVFTVLVVFVKVKPMMTKVSDIFSVFISSSIMSVKLSSATIVFSGVHINFPVLAILTGKVR
jgi:hypothetical protein